MGELRAAGVGSDLEVRRAAERRVRRLDRRQEVLGRRQRSSWTASRDRLPRPDLPGCGAGRAGGGVDAAIVAETSPVPAAACSCCERSLGSPRLALRWRRQIAVAMLSTEDVPAIAASLAGGLRLGLIAPICILCPQSHAPV